MVADSEATFILSGTGDVIEPDDGVCAIGSGGSYALAAARALVRHTELSARADRRDRDGDRRRDLHLHQREPHDRGAVVVTAMTEAAAHAGEDRRGARPLHRRPARRQARGRDRAAQPLAPPAGRGRAARRDRAEEHHHDRPDRRREDRDRAPPRQARARAVRQGRGVQVHRGRLRRPRRRLDRPRPRRGRGQAGARRGGRQGPRRAPRTPPRSALLDLLLPRAGGARRSPIARASRRPAAGADATREKLRAMLRDGKLDDARSRSSSPTTRTR